MARKKKGIVVSMPVDLASIKISSVGYGLHLVATGIRPKTPPTVGGKLRNVRIVLSERAQAYWDLALPKFPSRAALARCTFAVLKELGPTAQTVTFI